MVRRELHTITCPLCKTAYTREVEVVIDETFLGFVMSGDIFKQICPHCKKEFLYKRYVAYIDEKKKLLIVFATEDWTLLFSLDEFSKVLGNDKDYICRVVLRNHEDFIEKVGILNVGLNDVVAEVYKVLKHAKVNDKNIDNMIFEFNNDCSKYSLKVIYKDNHIEHSDIDSEVMNLAYEEVKSKGIIGRNNDYIVNGHLAMKILCNEDDFEPIHFEILRMIEEEKK